MEETIPGTDPQGDSKGAHSFLHKNSTRCSGQFPRSVSMNLNMNMVVMPRRVTALKSNFGRCRPEPGLEMGLDENFPDIRIGNQEIQHHPRSYGIEFSVCKRGLELIEIPTQPAPNVSAWPRFMLPWPLIRPVANGGDRSIQRLPALRIPIKKREIHLFSIFMTEMRQ